MKCVVCKHAETTAGRVTVTFERSGVTVVVKGVPAQVCPNCGEEYLSEETTKKLLQNAEGLSRSGTKIEIREYVVAE